MRRLFKIYSNQFFRIFPGVFLITMPLIFFGNTVKKNNSSEFNFSGQQDWVCDHSNPINSWQKSTNNSFLFSEVSPSSLCEIIAINNQEFNPQIKGVNLNVNHLLDSDDQNITYSLYLEARKSVIFPESVNWPQIHPQARLAKVPVLMYHDIVPKKEVFFDVTPEELTAHFELIRSQGMTPISLTELVNHLQTGMQLPDKPILLTFDDGYEGHYKYVFPLLKKYNYPAVFSVYINKMTKNMGRPGINWQQLQEMAQNPLVTIASHSITHPEDLRLLSDGQLEAEIFTSKQILEDKLEQPIFYFTYPVGKSDRRVEELVSKAGYLAALSMDDLDEHFAGDSESLLTIGRFGQSQLKKVIKPAWGGPPLPQNNFQFNFNSPITKREHQIDGIGVILISGGQPQTIHADSRYQVSEIIKKSKAIAGVDGTYFSLEYLDSDQVIGPIFSSNRKEFIPGKLEQNVFLRGRPLVLISDKAVNFIPFNPDRHNSLEAIKSVNNQLYSNSQLTDAFVAGAWLVRDGNPQDEASFNNLFDFDAVRHRAFWGINQAGVPVIGVSTTRVDSVALGKVLHQLGLREAVMLDSGGSTSLAYQGESLVGYLPRPVPHVVALVGQTQTAEDLY
jgi:peptidoglycan/xylan/chitin deacetylase (PgdA/CDA1 family)